MTPTSDPPGRIRWISIAAFAAWLFLFGTTYAYLPPLRHAWGLNLLRYQPDWAAWLVTGLALLLTTEEARRGVMRVARQLQALWNRLPTATQGPLLFGLVFPTCWILRERTLVGETQLLTSILTVPGRAAYPEPGATFVLAKLFDLASLIDCSEPRVARFALCAFGALAVVLVVRAARIAAPEGRATASIPLLAFTGGIGAAIAGRLDIQPLLLAACAAYLLAGLHFVRGGQRPLLPAAALGVLVWLEPGALWLLPSLVLLVRGRGAAGIATAVGVALLPLALYLVYLLAVNPKDLPTATVLARGLGSLRGWVRMPGGGPGRGTAYVLASAPHLKYLANAAFVLSGGALFTLVAACAVLRARPRRTPQLAFLLPAWAGLVVVSLSTRPPGGPWDWELFATTGLATCFVAGSALASIEQRDVRRHLVTAVVALQLAFVSLPLVSIGFGPVVDAGPFVQKRFDPRLFHENRRPHRRIAPWL